MTRQQWAGRGRLRYDTQDNNGTVPTQDDNNTITTQDYNAGQLRYSKREWWMRDGTDRWRRAGALNYWAYFSFLRLLSADVPLIFINVYYQILY